MKGSKMPINIGSNDSVGLGDLELMHILFPKLLWILNLVEHDFGDMTYPFLISGRDLELYASLR